MLKSPVSLLVFDGDLKDKERRGGGPVWIAGGAEVEIVIGRTGTGGSTSGGGAGAFVLDSDKRRDARLNEKPRCGTDAVSATAAELAAIVI